VENKIPENKDEFKLELKRLIITECQKDIQPEDIADDAILIGSEGKLDFDSLDALQISLAVQQKYGKRIEGNNETRFALTSINTLADYILS
jgi:acyl carrier protein